MTYKSIRVDPTTPHIGGVVEGIDMGVLPTAETVREIRDALLAHQVLFFRDQNITPEQQLEFGRCFGELEAHPFVRGVAGYPEMLLLTNDRENPPNINSWHSDVTFMERPAMGSILRGVVVPENGGDTLWANMVAAFEALSDKMQQIVSGLEALHDFEHVFFSADARFPVMDEADATLRFEKIAAARKSFPVMTHPVVRTHPETGRNALFVNPVFTLGIKDMNERESRAILVFLYQHIASPDFQVRFRWERNSVAFWDNRCTQHFAAADYWPHERCMHRVTLGGDRPFYHQPPSSSNTA